MNQNEYKLKINDPCTFRKNILEETLQILKAHSAPEALAIEKSLEVGGIGKPPNHQHPEGYDYYWVKCTSKEADKIASYLFEAEYSAIPDSGETIPEASRYGLLVNVWSNFRDWIENGGLV